MSRRKKTFKREIIPDPVFKDLVIAKFVNKMMIQGRKATSQKLFYGALKELEGKIPLILDGGDSSYGLESSIVWPHDGVLQILRPGPITSEMLCDFGKVITQPIEGKVPGSLKSHYAPRKKLTWFDPCQSPEKKRGLLAFSKRQEGFGALEVLSPSGNLKEAAANLYSALRRLDESNVESLLVESVPEEGIGSAIMDRLRRAIS
jgi:L-threonylcarbamoyladenylate synthase